MGIANSHERTRGESATTILIMSPPFAILSLSLSSQNKTEDTYGKIGENIAVPGGGKEYACLQLESWIRPNCYGDTAPD